MLKSFAYDVLINNFDSATKIERSCCQWLKGCYKGPVALTRIRSNTHIVTFQVKNATTLIQS